MKRSKSTGLFIVLMLAVWGFLLVYVPREVVRQYSWVSEFGPFWVRTYFIVVGTGAVLFLGGVGYIFYRLWRQKRIKQVERRERNLSPSELSKDQQRNEIDANLQRLNDLKGDEGVDLGVRRELEPMLQDFEAKREGRQLEIVVFGTVSSGKSSLLNLLAGRDIFATDARGGTTVRRGEVPWPGNDSVVLVDTPGLGEVDGAERVTEAAKAAQDADLVLFVVDGPLRESEYALVAKLAEMEKRVLVCLNKSDWYSSEDREKLEGQLKQQLKDVIEPSDLVYVQAEAVSYERTRVLLDGSEETEQATRPADIGDLSQRMMAVVKKDGADLLLANLLLQSRALLGDAKERVEASLDRSAHEIVDKYMWGAGGAAAISPLPILDLAAGSAITAKMVVDLARVYRQNIDLDSAIELLGQLGKNLVAILGVSLATPAMATAVATLLKTVPGAGTIAGGMLQGVVQAVVTRWIGHVFIKYFKSEMRHPEGGLTALARQEWSRLTTAKELRKIIQQARTRLQDGD